MNHYLLPGESIAERGSAAARYGVHLMELLINGLLKLGARRERLETKLFGGARTIAGLSDIGLANANFAKHFLAQEGIRITGASLGGNAGRRIQYWPTTGKARQMFISSGESLPPVDLRPQLAPATGDLELF